MKRFTRETLEVDEADDKVQLTTFKTRLVQRVRGFTREESPKMMAEMLLKAQKYINAENALVAIRDVEKPEEKGKKEDDRRGQKMEHPDRRINDGGKRKGERIPQTVKFTPLIMSIDKI